jgi:hypothetical protein
VSEPTVQVPVSLLEQMQRYFRSGSDTLSRRMAAELTTLLSQPTPTAELPRPEDMAPGTTFTARFVNPADGGGRFTNIDGFGVRDEAGRWCIARGIDPSTIRDVTPPAVTE